MSENGNICKYHYDHHGRIEKAQKDVERLYTKVNTAEKDIVKLETDLANMKSKAFIYAVAASILATVIFAVIQSVM